MYPIKISIVSYLNTIPLLYGLLRSDFVKKNCIISLDIPSACAENLKKGNVDIGLIPVAVLPQIPNHEIITDFCIGAKGKVLSVLLVSAVPLEEITDIYLDYQSKTSVSLVQLLAKEYWNISPVWHDTQKGYEKKTGGTFAALIIGDRTFEQTVRNHKYIYDLASEWTKYTSLPFVFACWTASRRLGEFHDKIVEVFNSAMNEGVGNIDKAIENRIFDCGKNSDYEIVFTDK